MKNFMKVTALAIGTVLASGIVFFGACTPADKPDEEPADGSTYTLTAETNACSLLVGDENYASGSATFLAKKDGETVEAPKLTYSIADPAIASVSADGVVTSKAYGKTELVATYKNATARVPVYVYERTTAENVNTFDEQYVNRFGRQYFTEGKLNVDHVSSGIEVAFLGDSLTVNVDVTNDPDGSGVHDVYVHTYIDGDTKGEFKVLTQGEYTLAENLGEGIHTVRMLKASEGDRGKFTVNSFDAEEFLRIPEKSDLKMEFIGDSITAGYGNIAVRGADGTMEGWSVHNSDGCRSYAALTGFNLNADFSVVALSGICLNVDRWGANIYMTQLHSYISYRNRDAYTYDADMDVVVLALGTNDAGYLSEVDTSYRNQFPVDYAAFLRHLRTIYPNAYVVCIYGMMGTNTNVEKGIKTALEDVNDAKMSYKSFTKNDAGANGHPSAKAHVTYATQLTAYIQELLG